MPAPPPKQMHPLAGMTMRRMVRARMAPTPAGAINPTYTPLDAAESARNYRIAANLRHLAHVNNVRRMRVVLPHDGNTDDRHQYAQRSREQQWYRQSAMPWASHFMKTPTDNARLNNPAQHSAMRQRQLTIPNSYGQFYAFMHALSAAFGTLQP